MAGTQGAGGTTVHGFAMRGLLSNSCVRFVRQIRASIFAKGQHLSRPCWVVVHSIFQNAVYSQ
jgi:hypothetical protein